MQRLKLLPLFCIAVGVCISGNNPTRHGNAQIDSLLTAGIDFTLKQEYDRALGSFKTLAQIFPDNPAGYVYQAALLQSIAMDYEEIIPDTPFDSLLSAAQEKAQRIIDREPESPWGYFFLGTTLGSEAFARAERGDWFGAVTHGISSVSNFEKAVSLDSQLVDAYTGIGTYYYWKSRKIEFLTWLPFVNDRREEGIELLGRCADTGVYNRFAAMSSLVNVYLDAAKYERAAGMARMALSQYPRNRIFLWGLATALERGNKPLEAIPVYERLLVAIQEDSRPNRYNELVCRINLLTLKSESGVSDRMRRELSEIRHLAQDPFPDHLEERVEDKREKIKKLEVILRKGNAQ